MGIGGAPEGVLTAAAMRCLGGEVQGRLLVPDEETRIRMREMGIPDPDRIYHTEDLAGGRSILFCSDRNHYGESVGRCTTFRGRYPNPFLLMRSSGRQVRFVDTIHVTDPDTGIHF